ncbi:hypothetical protein HY492_02195 [Candidatus Woesearchaeota archaeon]|nr:hypothetical protein [Candidatus Woesearchaeota archaeon]
MKNITQLDKWTRGIKDAKAKKDVQALIRRDLKKGGKPKARLETLFNTGKYQSLVSNINAMQPERYSVEGLVCELCGTHHKKGFLCRWPGNDGAQMELSAGGVCEAYLKALPGVREKFDDAITQATEAHQREIEKHLDDLLGSNLCAEPILIDTTPKSALRAKGAYLRNRLQGVASDELKEELERARTKDARLDQGMIAKLVELVKTQKKRPASAYQSIVKDVKLMETEGLAPEELHAEFKGQLTTEDANTILSETKEHYRSFRVRKNKAAMTHGSIDEMFSTLQPIVKDSKAKARRDFVAGYSIGDKVYTQRDTRFLLGLVKEWRTEREAVSLEPVVDFGKKYNRLALLSAKLAYAMDSVKAVEQEQKQHGIRQRLANRKDTEARLDAIAQTLHGPCHFVDDGYRGKIDFLQRCYSKDERITAAQPRLKELSRMAKQGFLPDLERRTIDKSYKRADLCCRPVEDSSKRFMMAKQAIQEGIITHIDFMDVERLRDDRTLIDWHVIGFEHRNSIQNALYHRREQMKQGKTGTDTHLGVTYTLSASKIEDLRKV